MTCARDDGRDDTAPYWTALRKYNGAPLLRCVHPNLDVGVGAAPLPRSERVYASSPLGGAGRLFFLSFYLSSSTALVCSPRRHPLIPPASSRTPHPPPRPLPSLPFSSSFFSYRRGHRATLREYPRCSPTFSTTRHTGATARFRCTSMATSAHAQRTRCDAEGSFLASAPCPSLLSPSFHPSSHPVFTLLCSPWR